MLVSALMAKDKNINMMLDDSADDDESVLHIEEDADEIDSESDNGDASAMSNYVGDAKKIIYTNDEININNALLFNRKLQANLKTLKSKLEALLQTCQKKYRANEITIAEIAEQTSSKKSQAMNTFYMCGQPYFKDSAAFPAPHTADYHARRCRELFPLDFEERNVFWMARDKIHLINGVKKQVLTHLRVKMSDQIRKLATKRRSSEVKKITDETFEIEQWHLKELFAKIDDKNFGINWYTISVQELNGRHTSNECEGMWTGYLMPTLNRKSWTSDEEDQLLCVATQYGAQNWPEIAQQVRNRSSYQCFVHYRTVLSERFETKNTRWTQEEDDTLMQLVEKYRIGTLVPWTKIKSRMPGRCKAQIYNRYMFSLNPQINRGRFTVEEDCILMAAVKEYGENFNNFPPNLLAGRSAVQIRNRYNNVLKHVGKREHWTLDHDLRLMELVKKHGESDWARIAKEILIHNRTSCRSRFTTITKFLKKHPNSKVEDVPRRKRPFSSNVTADNWMEKIIKEKHRDLVVEDDDEDDFAYGNQRTYSAITTNAIGQAYHRCFRYAYNFQYGERIVPANENLFENLQIVCRLLDSPESNNERSFSDYVTIGMDMPRIVLDRDFANSLVQMGRNDFTFPINLNTIMGFRAIHILNKCQEITELTESTDANESLLVPKPEPSTSRTRSDRHERHPALALFRRRFMSLFKNTAMLANLYCLPTTLNVPRVRLMRGSAAYSHDHQPTVPTTTMASDIDSDAANAEGLINETIIICNNESQQRIENLITSSGSAAQQNAHDQLATEQMLYAASASRQPNDSTPFVIDGTETEYTLTEPTSGTTYKIRVMSSASDDDQVDLTATFKEEKDNFDKLEFESPPKKKSKND